MMKDEIELSFDYPANVAKALQTNKIDIGLVPVAIIPTLKEHYIISDYGIACRGEVASVCLFSDVPLEDIETIILDYQSRTSVNLLKILLKEYWKITPELIAGAGNYEQQIGGKVAGLVIGDRALIQRKKSKFIFDLGSAWQHHTGLPFMFAAWVSNKKMSDSFFVAFNDATKMGLTHIEEIVAENNFEYFSLTEYYTRFIKFRLEADMHEALALFLNKLKQAV